MGQDKAAAQRKTGIKARGYYLVSGLLVALYVYFYSLDQIFIIWNDFKSLRGNIDLFVSLDGSIIIQKFTLLFASLCASWYVLTGTRYSYFTVNKELPKLNTIATLFISVYYPRNRL